MRAETRYCRWRGRAQTQRAALACSRNRRARMQHRLYRRRPSEWQAMSAFKACNEQMRLSEKPRTSNLVHAHPACCRSARSGYLRSASSSKNFIHDFRNLEPLERMGMSAIVTLHLAAADAWPLRMRAWPAGQLQLCETHKMLVRITDVAGDARHRSYLQRE